MSPTAPSPRWSDVREQLRRRGLRWTPQRRLLLEVLSSAEGHVNDVDRPERREAGIGQGAQGPGAEELHDHADRHDHPPVMAVGPKSR